jgi:hypothetical protein
MSDRHRAVCELAFRLLQGEVVEGIDRHGRRWRGTSSSLSVVLPGSGEAGAVLENVDAYDVAVALSSWITWTL